MTSKSITHAKRPRSIVRHFLDFIVLGVTILVAWALWPSFLGGSSQIIMVQGHSMEPTYQPGALILLDTDFTPGVGSVIVFHIPEGELGAGALVVHRIVGQRADGTYITQGDNTQNVDAFRVARSDILGTPRFAVPHGGRVISVLTSPVAMGAAAGFMTTILLWPRGRPPAPVEYVGLAIDDDGWSSLAIPEQVQAEADAWLQSQLAQVP